jgi:hypothetical protein
MKAFNSGIASALLVASAILAFGAEPEKKEAKKTEADQSEAEKKGYEIMLKNYEQMTTKNFRADVKMQLIDSDGSVQTRHVKRLSQTDDKDQESYHVRFLEPATVRDTTLLILEKESGEDDIWFYLPAMNKVKRVCGADLRGSYMGTEFSFKDVKREKIPKKLQRWVLVGSEKLDGADHHVIEAFSVTPEEQKEQGYQKRKFWIRKDNYLVSKAEFYDEDGDFLKRLICSDMREVGTSGKVRYFTYTMTSNKGRKTILHWDLLKINEEPIDEKFFSKAYLERKR